MAVFLDGGGDLMQKNKTQNIGICDKYSISHVDVEWGINNQKMMTNTHDIDL